MADYAIHDTTLISQADILRKKFGTNDRQDPADYASKMNLMGLLEEKTQASASVCSFDDGADDVPTKSLIVTIPPTLTGVSEVSETQTGRNICSVAPWVRDTTFYGSNWTEMVAFLNTLPVGNYSVSYDYEITELLGSSIDVAYSPYIRALVNGSYVNVTAYSAPQTDSSPTVGKIYHCSASFSLTSQTVGNLANFYLYCGQSGIKVAEVTVKNAMVELGSTVSAYEPYTPTQYTANLGRTIYGGEVDIVNGTGTETEKGKWLSELSWTQNATFPHVFNGTGFTDRKKGINWNNATCLSDRYTGYTSSEVGTKSEGIALATGATNTTIYVSDDRFETVAEFTASLVTDDSFVVLPLETPTDFTFDGQEIPTRLGVNNFWSDSGDTEVTYRSSGTITPVLPTLVSKTITENGTYSAEDDGADGYDEVTVNVSGGGGGSCERLFYARCYDNYQVEIPTISSLVQGTNYSSYVSYSTSTKKFTALQDFTAVIIGWVYTCQTYEASYSQGAFIVNNKRLATYTATGKTQGSTGGAYMVYNFKQGDEFYPYTPSTDGYPRQNCKVYLVSDLDDDIYTFADEEA